MQIHEHVPLSSLTTLKVGGNARFVAVCATEEELITALAHAREGGLPWYVIGGGSNILARDEGYDGVIIQPLFPELSFGEVTNSGDCLVIAGAGVVWDTLVDESVARGLWGLENLAAIPGLVGGAPVQNIGAYGADVSDTLLYVEALDTKTNSVFRLTKTECNFGYRDSRFKHDPSLIILHAAFLLSKNGEPKTDYPDLARARHEGAVLTTPTAIAESVRGIRAHKFPDLSVSGTAGSFFKNPIISTKEYADLQAIYPGIPSFPVTNPFSSQSAAAVKVPLAWILDKILNLRGYTKGRVSLFEHQPLVLVTSLGATASEVESLAEYVENVVKEKTRIVIEREVRTL